MLMTVFKDHLAHVAWHATGLLSLFALPPGVPARPQQQSRELVRVGLLESVFDQQEKNQVLSQLRSFAEVVQRETNTKAEFDIVDRPTLVKDFNAGKAQVAILTGIEYGWIKDECPDAKPLLIATIEGPTYKTVVLTQKDNQAKSLVDLKGQALVQPKRMPYLTRFYLRHAISAEPQKFFRVNEADNADAAIEDVVDGKAQAVAISASGFKVYQERKPGGAKRLGVLAESAEFPAAVVIYNTKGADVRTVKDFERSLRNADQTPEGRQLLTLYHLKRFEDVPADYERRVAEIESGTVKLISAEEVHAEARRLIRR